MLSNINNSDSMDAIIESTAYSQPYIFPSAMTMSQIPAYTIPPGNPNLLISMAYSPFHSPDTLPHELYPTHSDTSSCHSTVSPSPEIKNEYNDESSSQQCSTPEVVDNKSQENSRPKSRPKRENRYKNASAAIISRRRAQNRASQRAYRERKDQRIRDLELELGKSHRIISNLQQTLQQHQHQHQSQQQHQIDITHAPSVSHTPNPTPNLPSTQLLPFPSQMASGLMPMASPGRPQVQKPASVSLSLQSQQGHLSMGMPMSLHVGTPSLNVNIGETWGMFDPVLY